MFKKVSHLAFQRPWFVLIFTLGFFSAAIYGLRNLKIELDIYSMKDPQFQSTISLDEMKESFKDFNTLIFVANWKKEATTADLCNVSKRLSYLAQEIPFTYSVQTPFDLRTVALINQRIEYPLLLDRPCEAPKQLFSDYVRPLAQVSSMLLNSEKLNSFFVVVRLNEKIEGKHLNKKYLAAIGSWFNGLRATSKEDGLTWHMVGPASFRYHFQKTLAKDSVVSLLLLPFVLIFMRLFFGTWRSGFYFVLTALFTVIMTLGFMGSLGYPVDVLTNSLLMMIVIAGASDYIFVSNQQLQGYSLRDSILRITTPGFFTTLTTALGFASLALGDYQIIKRFGLSAAVGSILEWYFIFVVIPAALTVFKKDFSWVSRYKSLDTNIFKPIVSYCVSKKTALAFLGLAGMAFYFSTRLNTFDEPIKYFSENHPLRQDTNKLREFYGWSGQLYLLFPNTVSEAEINKCFQKIVQNPLVAGVENPLSLKQFVLKDLPADLADASWRTVKYSGFFQQYFQTSFIRGQVFVKDLNSTTIENVSGAIRSQCPQAQVTGQSEVFKELSQKVTSTLWSSFFGSFVLVFLVIVSLMFYKKEKNYAAVAFSIISGPMVCISLMGLFEVPINIITCIFLAVLVGMAGDNAIQYLFAKSADNLNKGIDDQSSASVIFAIFLTLGSSLLLFQTLVPVRILGLMFAAGSIINLAGDLWVLRRLLDWSPFRFNDFIRKLSVRFSYARK